MNHMVKNALLNALRAEDFVVYETALFLNTHPNNIDALNYFKAHKEKASALRGEYESHFGPLTLNSSASCDKGWNWINSPWPWEKEAN